MNVVNKNSLKGNCCIVFTFNSRENVKGTQSAAQE